MKHIYGLILFLSGFFLTSLTAQTATEAYRLSVSDPIGTARNLGSGNSMFAIGPDISAVGSNPAGIGAFWKSEFTITLGGQFNNYASYFSQDRSRITNGNYGIFTLPNVGFILTSRPGGSMITSNWSIGYNRMAEYRRELNYSGSTIGSITDAWRENAFGKPSSDLNGFEEGLAYTSGAIYDFEEDRVYETDYQLSPEYSVSKFENAYLEGGKSELYIGYGANIDNKVLVGFTFNMPLVNYTEFRDYGEADGLDNGVPYFNNLNYHSYVNSTGYGINGKFGVTFKPTQHLNLSFAAHTPSRYFMTDDYNSSVTYDYTDQNNNGPIYSESPYGNFQYAMVTPWSLMGGIGIIAGDNGFIGASIKWTDYGAMHYDYSIYQNGYYYEQEEYEVNQDIREQYASAFDINVGGEMVFKALRLRGGASLAQSPFNNDNAFDPSYHAGIGYRHDVYYIDFGYRWTNRVEGYLPYETTNATQPLVQIDNNRHTVIMTAGFKF
jgi:hypothetical protein